MLDVALTFLVDSFNSYLARRTGGDFGKAMGGRLVDDTGKWAVEVDHLGASLLSVEEERVMRSPLPESRLVNGRHVVLAPELRLNLHVLFAANFQKYDQALKYLSHVLTYFQAHSSFTRDDSPDLDPQIGKLVVELQSMTFEQLNQVWAFVGGKQLPSVVYKVRMVVLQDQEAAAVSAPITTLNVAVGHA